MGRKAKYNTEEERYLAYVEYYKNDYIKNKEKRLKYQKEYYQKHKEKQDEYREAWCKENPLIQQGYHLKYKFGVTVEQYYDIFNKQNGCCAICGIHQDNLKRKLHVDHDHKTLKIRGLLCSSCNILLGGAKDNIERLNKAIIYLIKNKV